jgi:hypothetical protein
MSAEVFGFGLRLCASFSSGEVLCRRARVQSQVERSEPKGNFDGFLSFLYHSPQNEGKETEPISELGVNCGCFHVCEFLR